MFRKVPFLWAIHFPKLLAIGWKGHTFLTQSGSVHLLSVRLQLVVDWLIIMRAWYLY